MDRKRPHRAIPVRTRRFESQSCVEVLDHAVLRRWDVGAHDLRQPTWRRPLDELVPGELLDAPLEHPAAHHPGVDRHRPIAPLDEDHADQAIVSQVVLQAERERQPVGGPGDLAHLRERVAAGGQVELVRLVDELGRALEVQLVDRLDLHPHAQRRQEGVEIGAGRGQLACAGRSRNSSAIGRCPRG